ncbi:unnamed protein product, partial [Didymodactylos carnosus]
RQRRENFRKTTANECGVLNEATNSGTQLPTTSEEREEEINDNQQVQLQQGVIGTMDQDRTLLFSKLYGTLEQ